MNEIYNDCFNNQWISSITNLMNVKIMYLNFITDQLVSQIVVVIFIYGYYLIYSNIMYILVVRNTCKIVLLVFFIYWSPIIRDFYSSNHFTLSDFKIPEVGVWLKCEKKSIFKHGTVRDKCCLYHPSRRNCCLDTHLISLVSSRLVLRQHYFYAQPCYTVLKKLLYICSKLEGLAKTIKSFGVQ